jgi:[ribosomal protein S18]-alanine N-acetyltransferase
MSETDRPGIWHCRSMGPAELEAAARIHHTCFASGPQRAWSPRDFAELLAMPGTFGELVAVDRTEVGISLARLAADEAELLTIGVLPGHRRQGLARCLLGHVVDVAGAHDATALFLEVAEDNAAARNFYLKEGFTEVGRRPGYYGNATANTIAAIIMRRPVATNG